MRASIIAKIWIALAMVLVVALSLTAFLNFAKFEKSFSNLVQSRFAFVAEEARSAIERSLGFGLSISQIENVQAVIERMRAQDPSITAIEVFDTQGAIVFTSDRVGVGEGVPAEWVRAASSNKAEPWTWRDDEGYAVGLPLINALGLVEGGVVVRYSLDLLDARISDTFLGLARISGLMMAVFSVLALIGVALVLRPALRAYRVIEHDLPMLVATGHAAAATGETEELARIIRSADQQLAQAYRDVERLDHSS